MHSRNYLMQDGYKVLMKKSRFNEAGSPTTAQKEDYGLLGM
jgi:hypothetical protein